MKMSGINRWFLSAALLFVLAVSGCSNEGPPRVIETDPEEILDPEAFLLGTTTLFADGYGIFVSDYIAYIFTTDGSQGTLVLFDITDPDFLTYISELNSLFIGVNIGNAGQFEAAGTPQAAFSAFIYLPVGAQGIHAVDVSDAYTPTLVTTLPTIFGSAVIDVDASDNFVCAANGNSALTISSSQTGVFPANLTAISVDTDAAYCYLIETTTSTTTPARLRVIDPSIITAPVEVGSVELDGREIFVSGSYAYVLVEDVGLAIVDISDPTAPAIISQTDPAPTVKDVFSIFTVDITLKRAYISSPNGVRIIDISDPYFPVDIGGFELHDQPTAIAANNGIVYITTKDPTGFNPSQLLLVDVSQF